MNLCSQNHTEICHEGRDCPLCGVVGELEEANDSINDLKGQVAELKTEIEELKESQHE
jgi:transcription initiation factor IIE alpha subunit